jgi:hypothetical protein
MQVTPHELDRALEWVLPLGVCCAEAQADGVPCAEIGRDCLACERAEPVRKLLLRMAMERIGSTRAH